MRNPLFRNRNIMERPAMGSATVVANECHGMVRQMALTFVTERRVKGALGIVSRESGVSYSKLRKIYYRLTDHILEFEFRNIAEAYKRHVLAHEQKLAHELETLRSLIAEREIRDRQHALDLPTPSRAVAASQNAVPDMARD